MATIDIVLKDGHSGDMKEKVDPYLRPLYDALYDLFGFEKINHGLNFFGPVNIDKVLILDINGKIKKNKYLKMEFS